MHENITNREKCVVRLYNKYINKCPKDVEKSTSFYMSPKKQFNVDDKVWFTYSLMGKNTLRNVVQDL